MVSLKKSPLKKEQQVREYTPVHLMDEEEAVRTYCPPKETPIAEDVKKTIKQNDEDLLSAVNEKHNDKPVKKVAKTFCGLDVWEWVENIVQCAGFVGVIITLIFMVVFWTR